MLQAACFILEIDLKMKGNVFGVPEKNFLHFVKYPLGRPGRQAGGGGVAAGWLCCGRSSDFHKMQDSRNV